MFFLFLLPSDIGMQKLFSDSRWGAGREYRDRVRAGDERGVYAGRMNKKTFDSMTIEDNQCTKIFQDLLNKRYIIASQILEETDACRYFCVKPPKTIFYNPNMKVIHRNSIHNNN